MTGNVVRSAMLLATVAALAACSGSQPPKKADTTPAVPPDRDLIAEVRALAADANDGLDVTPLRDPVVTDLRDSAARYEAARAFAKAEASLAQALLLIPGDPELTQWQAELVLAQGRYDDAVQLANSAWEHGPRLGALCRRSWATIRLARELAGHLESAAAANAQMARCTIEPPVRM